MPLDCRVAAARVLAQVLGGSSLNSAMPPLLTQVPPRDRGLLQQLCYGTLRQQPRLQALLSPLLAKPLKERDRDLQALMLLGLYQLEDTRIPPHAAVSATVAATRGLRKQWARGLVNAVLRRYQRERESLCSALDEAAAAAHPRWLHQALWQQWGEAAGSIIEANNRQPPMSLRVNLGLNSRDEYLASLRAAQIEARPGGLAPEGVRLAQPLDVAALPGFEAGLASVQDEAAQLAAHLLGTAPGERVLDACAAPGGKTCHILELQPRLAQLVAMDLEPRRLERVAENLARLGLRAELLCADAAAPPPELTAGGFDRILVDAPCSASGVIRRHPDVKLLRREGDIPALAQQQLRILRGLWPLLGPGGTMLYATCSVLEEENSRVVQAFLQQCPEAQLRLPDASWGVPRSHGRQLLPDPAGADGLFYALLYKAPA